jgi:hypothetical protein
MTDNDVQCLARRVHYRLPPAQEGCCQHKEGAMRTWLMLAAIATSLELTGCKTAEIAVNHQMTGIHVVAKFEGKDESAVASDEDEPQIAVRKEYVLQ